MSQDEKQNDGQAGRAFVWLGGSSTWTLGRRLVRGALHKAEQFRPDVLAEWMKTGDAAWATAEDMKSKPWEHEQPPTPYEEEHPPASFEEVLGTGQLWPWSYYYDGARVARQPGLFKNPADDALRKLREKLNQAGIPGHELDAEQDLEKLGIRRRPRPSRLGEARFGEMRLGGPGERPNYFLDYAPVQTAFIEMTAPGDSRATRIKWFWFINTLVYFAVFEGRAEWVEINNCADPKEQEERAAAHFVKSMRRACELFGIVVPEIADEWIGEKSIYSIIRRPGVQVDMAIYERIIDQTPLRADGFTKSETSGVIVWEKRFGRRRSVKLTTPEISAGDVARRVALALMKFPAQRETLMPGPIEFGPFLEAIGEEDCSQEQRGRIRGYITALENIAVKVTETDKKGREIWHDYSPLLKRLVWQGGTEQEARFYPIFNEEFPQVMKAANQYAYIQSARLRGLPAERTDQEHFVLDFFVKKLGLPIVKRKMMGFLIEDARVNEATLRKWGLPTIKKTVLKWFELAKSEQLIRGYSIGDINKRRDYLAQTIVYHPHKEQAPKKLPDREDVQAALEVIINWQYAPENKQYPKKSYSEAWEVLKNTIYSVGDVALVMQLWADTEGQGMEWRNPDDPTGPPRPRTAWFWDLLREAQANVKKPRRAMP